MELTCTCTLICLSRPGTVCYICFHVFYHPLLFLFTVSSLLLDAVAISATSHVAAVGVVVVDKNSSCFVVVAVVATAAVDVVRYCTCHCYDSYVHTAI